MSENRGGDGRFERTVSDDDILYYFETGQRPFHSTSEIATQFDLSRQHAHRRLEDLADRGLIHREELGKRNTAWWKPRDVIVLAEEDNGFSAHDLRVGVASQGPSRSEALRQLAEAIEVHQGDSELDPTDIYAELGIDPDDVDEDASPPFQGDSG